MSSASIRSDAEDLAWSLWTELGVAGVVRKHEGTVIDPEPLLAATPALASGDPRLLEQVLSWCACHADRVNTGRLTALVKTLRPSARAAFEAFGATANAVAGTNWPSSGSPWSPLPRMREVPLPLDRPAGLRLRARALCGVGTRADVLCDLLAHRRGWVTASQLAEGGHSKRNVARVLAELDEAGMVVRHAAGNGLRFRLAQPAALSSLLAGDPEASPDWIRIFELAIGLLDVVALEATPSAVRRVEAHALRDALQPPADRLSLSAPPRTRGEPKAWELLIEWGTEQMAALAGGDHASMGVGAGLPRAAGGEASTGGAGKTS